MNTVQQDYRDERPQAGPGAPPPYQVPPAPAAPGARQIDARMKSPALAGFLSGIFPGLGQIYVGYYQRGLTFALVVAGIITSLASGLLEGLEPMLGIGIGFTYLLNIIDANRLANLYNQAVQGLGATELPDKFTLPEERGSMAGGVVLVVLGGLLLLNRLFDISLDWIADWWPLGVVALGIWLILKARKGRES